MASKKLRKIQIGLETTAGTPVAATVIWRGTGTIRDERVIRMPDEDVGFLSGIDRSYTASLGGRISLAPVEATFEQLPILFTCGLAEDTAGTQDGEGSGYVYTYTAGTSAAASLSTVTVEGGDNQQAEEMEYGCVERIRLTGAPGEGLMMSGDIVGRQVSTTTFTASLSLPSVEEIVFSKGKLYIDAVSGTIGTTEKSSTLLGVDIDIPTGLVVKRAANGQLYFDSVVQTGVDPTVQLTYEHNGTAVSEIAAWRAETPRQIRLKWEGSALTTSGTYTNKTFILDMAGKYETFEAIDEMDGNDIVRATFRPRWDTTASLFLQAIIVNESAQLF